MDSIEKNNAVNDDGNSGTTGKWTSFLSKWLKYHSVGSIFDHSFSLQMNRANQAGWTLVPGRPCRRLKSPGASEGQPLLNGSLWRRSET